MGRFWLRSIGRFRSGQCSVPRQLLDPAARHRPAKHGLQIILHTAGCSIFLTAILRHTLVSQPCSQAAGLRAARILRRLPLILCGLAHGASACSFPCTWRGGPSLCEEALEHPHGTPLRLLACLRAATVRGMSVPASGCGCPCCRCALGHKGPQLTGSLGEHGNGNGHGILSALPLLGGGAIGGDGPLQA